MNRQAFGKQNMENVLLQGFCLEGLQPPNALRFFLGIHMKCNLAKLALESPHRHFKTSQC